MLREWRLFLDTGSIDPIGIAVLVGILVLVVGARFGGWGNGLWPPSGPRW